MPEGDIANSGCLMVNSVFEIPEKPERVQAVIDTYRDMWRDRFQQAHGSMNVRPQAPSHPSLGP